MKKKLILLTSEYPYGRGETFLENEFPFLVSHFDDVVIFSECKKGKSRVKDTITVVRLMQSGNLWTRIISFFKKEFYNELNHLIKNKNLNISTFRTAWYSLSKALSIVKQLESTEGIERSIFYSYWLDEKATALALLKKKNLKIKAVSRAHGWDIYEERHPNNYLPYRNLLAEQLDSVYSISDDGNRYLKERYPTLNKKIFVSRLGTFPAKSIPKKGNVNQFIILSISSIIPLKRVDKILEVVSSFTKIKIKWIHIGEGPDIEKLNENATRKSNENRFFSFELLGKVPNSEVRGILCLQYFDLFMNLSTTEGIPVSIMEAQSVGIPALVSNVGGTSEIVNKENGFLVDKNFDVRDVVSIIENYFEGDNKEYQNKRNISYTNWEKKYSAKNYIKFVDLLNLN